MIYRIEYSSRAAKQIRKFEKALQRRVLATIERARVRPYEHFERLVGSQHYKLRIGDYRAIIGIYDRVMVILIIEIAHRKKVYGR